MRVRVRVVYCADVDRRAVRSSRLKWDGIADRMAQQDAPKHLQQNYFFWSSRERGQALLLRLVVND